MCDTRKCTFELCSRHAYVAEALALYEGLCKFSERISGVFGSSSCAYRTIKLGACVDLTLPFHCFGAVLEPPHEISSGEVCDAMDRQGRGPS